MLSVATKSWPQATILDGLKVAMDIVLLVHCEEFAVYQSLVDTSPSDVAFIDERRKPYRYAATNDQ